MSTATLEAQVAAFFNQVHREVDPLAKWMSEHRTPGYKPWKPTRYVTPKPKRGRGALFVADAKEYEYTITSVEGGSIDLRKPYLADTGHLSTEEWLELAHSPTWKFKPYTVPASPLTRLSTAARHAEERRVAAYVASR